MLGPPTQPSRSAVCGVGWRWSVCVCVRPGLPALTLPGPGGGACAAQVLNRKLMLVDEIKNDPRKDAQVRSSNRACA